MNDDKGTAPIKLAPGQAGIRGRFLFKSSFIIKELRCFSEAESKLSVTKMTM